jgi:hypothetical protein
MRRVPLTPALSPGERGQSGATSTERSSPRRIVAVRLVVRGFLLRIGEAIERRSEKGTQRPTGDGERRILLGFVAIVLLPWIGIHFGRFVLGHLVQSDDEQAKGWAGALAAEGFAKDGTRAGPIRAQGTHDVVAGQVGKAGRRQENRWRAGQDAVKHRHVDVLGLAEEPDCQIVATRPGPAQPLATGAADAERERAADEGEVGVALAHDRGGDRRDQPIRGGKPGVLGEELLVGLLDRPEQRRGGRGARLSVVRLDEPRPEAREHSGVGALSSDQDKDLAFVRLTPRRRHQIDRGFPQASIRAGQLADLRVRQNRRRLAPEPTFVMSEPTRVERRWRAQALSPRRDLRRTWRDPSGSGPPERSMPSA